MKWEIEGHDGVDKSFGMGNNQIWMKVDYDDVNHPEVDAAAKYVKILMETCWDNEQFKELYKTELIHQWHDNEDIQGDYPVIEQYIESRIGNSQEDHSPNHLRYRDDSGSEQ